MAVTFPSVLVACAFSTNPTAPPTWTDISPYARSFGVHRGRQFELDRMQAGTAQVLLNNQDRRFDPYHTGSPYSPNVLPRRQLRIQATWASVLYPVFSGYVETWPQTWDLSGKMAEVNVPVSDAFAVFGQKMLNATFAMAKSDVRVSDVLTNIGWASGFSSSPGAVLLRDATLVNTTALEHLLSVAASENGKFFIMRDGSASFMARNYGVSTVFATFGDGAGELPYSDLELGTSPIWNDIRLTATGGLEQVSGDAGSVAKYFPVSKVESGYLQASDGDLQSLAGWWLLRYKEPQQRVTSMTISPSRSPTLLWPQVLGREIGDHVIVKRRPPGGGTVLSQESVIEGIEHAASNHQWTTRFSLSPAEPLTAWAFVGSALVGTSLVAY